MAAFTKRFVSLLIYRQTISLFVDPNNNLPPQHNQYPHNTTSTPTTQPIPPQHNQYPHNTTSTTTTQSIPPQHNQYPHKQLVHRNTTYPHPPPPPLKKQTYPHNANLYLSKMNSNNCPLCHEDHQDLVHVPTSCKIAMKLRHYNEKHDWVLAVVYETISQHLPNAATSMTGSWLSSMRPSHSTSLMQPLA